MNVDINVEWSGLNIQQPCGKDEEDDIGQKELDLADEVLYDWTSTCNDDDDIRVRRRHVPEFNVVTDLADPQFRLGMVFISVNVIRKAIVSYGIKQ